MGSLKQAFLAAPFVYLLIGHADPAAGAPRLKATVKAKGRCSIKFATVEVMREGSKGDPPEASFRLALADGHPSKVETSGAPLSALLRLRCEEQDQQNGLALIQLTLNLSSVDRSAKRRPVRSTTSLSISSRLKVGEGVLLGSIRPLRQPAMNVWIKLE